MRAGEHVDIVVGLHRLQDGAKGGEGKAERFAGAFDRRATQAHRESHELRGVEEEARERAHLGGAEDRHILAADLGQCAAVEGHAKLVLPVDRYLHDHGLDVDLLPAPIELLDDALERQEVAQAGDHNQRVGRLVRSDGDIAREGRRDCSAGRGRSTIATRGSLIARTPANSRASCGLLARLLYILRQRLQRRG